MEPVTVLIPTYNRQDILLGTIQRLYYHFQYSGPWSILIGDDSDDHGLTKQYVASAGMADLVTVVEGPRRGLGANLNVLLQKAESEIVMQMDDDHWLEHGVLVDEYVHELTTDPAFGWIRLFMGDEWDSGNKQTYYNFVARTYGRYWRLIPNQGELYIPSNRPHLKRKEFHRRYGPYTEDVKLGEQETLFCHTFADMWPNDGTLDVFIPMYPPPITAWKHVGESWQSQGL